MTTYLYVDCSIREYRSYRHRDGPTALHPRYATAEIVRELRVEGAFDQQIYTPKTLSQGKKFSQLLIVGYANTKKWSGHGLTKLTGSDAPVLKCQWALFITHSRLLFYFLFRTRSIYFRNIYCLQMALVV